MAGVRQKVDSAGRADGRKAQMLLADVVQAADSRSNNSRRRSVPVRRWRRVWTQIDQQRSKVKHRARPQSRRLASHDARRSRGCRMMSSVTDIEWSPGFADGDPAGLRSLAHSLNQHVPSPPAVKSLRTRLSTVCSLKVGVALPLSRYLGSRCPQAVGRSSGLSRVKMSNSGLPVTVNRVRRRRFLAR